ncbi:MAG: TolC family protein [Chitinivibrionales bacterium]|nr:TolC family protein [Chitinivibrionales bacterium]
MDSALSLALVHNKEIQQASKQIILAQNTYNQTKAEFLPSVSASVSSSKRITAVSTSSTSDLSINASASSEVTLFDGFATSLKHQKAFQELSGSMKALIWKKESVINAVYSHYIQTVLDSELVRIAYDNYEAQKQQLLRIEEFAKTGVRSNGDVLAQRATVAQAELKVLNAHHDYLVDKIKLLQLIGIKYVGNDFNLDSPVTTDSTGIEFRFSSDTAIASVIEKRTDIQAQRASFRAAQLQIDIAKSVGWPQISLSAAAGTSYQMVSEGESASSQLFEKNPDASVGLKMSVPIFDKFRKKYAVINAQTQTDVKAQEVKTMELAAQFEVSQALFEYQTALKQITVAQVELLSARQALEAAQARYAVGASTLTDLTQLQAQYTSALNDRIKAVYTAHVRIVAIAYYTGTLGKMFPQFFPAAS